MNILLYKPYLIAIITGCFCYTTLKYEGAQVLRVRPRTSRHVQVLNELETRSQPDTDETETISFLKRPKAIDGESDILVPRRHLKYVEDTLSEVGLSSQVMIHDVRQKILQEQEQKRFKRNNNEEDFYSQYQGYEAIQQRLKYLEEKYPDLVQTQAIGTTTENRDLTVAKLRRENSKEDKKVMYIEGGIHAREWIGPAVSMFLMERILEEPSILDDTDLYILPLLNPDGYEYTRHSDRMWRKNRSVNLESHCKGTDLNRNFDFEWMHSDSSNQPCSEIYAGSGPASEEEVSAVQRFLKTLDSLDLYVALHNYGQLWFHPWAYKNNDPPDTERMTKIGEIAVEKVKQKRGIGYQYGRPASLLYAASGSSMDWVWHEISKKNPDLLSYTIELRDKGTEGFFLSAKYISPTAEDIWVGLKCIHYQMSTGHENCDY